MISAKTFREYNESVAALSGEASRGVERSIMSWCEAHPDASVGEIRDCGKRVMEAFAQTYDEAASTLAAELYDSTVGAEAKLEVAITSTVYDPSSPDAVARYQAKKLATGDVRAFAQACGEFVANDSLRALNKTVIDNVGRDKDRGVRFARVPTGAETCTFCMMLASRGAEYHTRESAGEFSHFHRRCDCKVVPGLADDPMAVLVEGCDPKDYYGLWKKFEKIDSSGFPKAQAEAIKAAWIDSSAFSDSSVVKPSELSATYDAGMRDAWSHFKRNMSDETYSATVGAYLTELGEAWGINLSGNSIKTSAGGISYACPKDGELWPVSKLSGKASDVVYQAEDAQRNGNPDLLIDGLYADIKSPQNYRKAKHLMAKAAKQCEAVTPEKSCCIVSTLNYQSDITQLIEKAGDFVTDGTFTTVYVALKDGASVL